MYINKTALRHHSDGSMASNELNQTTLNELYLDNGTMLSSMRGNETEENDYRAVYLTVPLVLAFFCLLAVYVNARILFCIKWIRRPLTPTILISLSLTSADTFTAFMIGLGFMVNSYLAKGWDMDINLCVILVIEAFRLSGILVSTTHLFALAANHYFGILCPLRSMTMLTPKTLKGIIFSLWFIPTLYIFGYFTSFKNEAFQRRDCHIEPTFFLYYKDFRSTFSYLFFGPMAMMFIIYMHISILVKRHQALWRWFNRYSQRQDNPDVPNNNQRKNSDRNVKAIWTSLFILSTYSICFVPAVMNFYLICNDCYFRIETVDKGVVLVSSSVTNFLLITKYLINPFIYASRMKEIQLAMKQMNAKWRKACCTCGREDELDLELNNRVERSNRFSLFSSSSRRQNIELNSIQVQNHAGTSGTPV